jgi:hypothetical protein
MRRVVMECDDLGFTAAIDSLGTRRAVRRCAWADVSATQYDEVPGIYGRVGHFSLEANGQPMLRVDARRTPRFDDLVATVNAHATKLAYTWQPRSGGARGTDGLPGYIRCPRSAVSESAEPAR